MKNVKNLVNGAKEMMKGKASKIAMATTSILAGLGINAYALPSDDGIGMINNTIDTVLSYLQGLGACVCVFGIVGFIMAWKSNNSENQTNSAMFVVAGFLLCSIRPVLSKIGVL